MEDCSFTPILVTNIYRILQVVHCSSAFVSLILLTVLLKKFSICLYTHVNVRMLIYFILTMLTINCLFSGTLLFMHIVAFLRYDAVMTCASMFINGVFCFCTRIPVNLSMTAMVLAQCSMALDRICSLLLKERYQKDKGMIGVSLIGLTIFATGSFCFRYLSAEDWSKDQSNCAIPSGNEANMEHVVLLRGLLLVDIFTCVLYLIIYLINNSRKKERSFLLNNRFDVNESSTVVSLMGPLTIIHTVIFSVYIGGFVVLGYIHMEDTVTYVLLHMLFYFVPYYTICVPLSLMYVIRKIQKNKTSKVHTLLSEPARGSTGVEEHFRTLREAWNAPPTLKTPARFNMKNINRRTTAML